MFILKMNHFLSFRLFCCHPGCDEPKADLPGWFLLWLISAAECHISIKLGESGPLFFHKHCSSLSVSVTHVLTCSASSHMSSGLSIFLHPSISHFLKNGSLICLCFVSEILSAYMITGSMVTFSGTHISGSFLLLHP